MGREDRGMGDTWKRETIGRQRGEVKRSRQRKQAQRQRLNVHKKENLWQINY